MEAIFKNNRSDLTEEYHRPVLLKQAVALLKIEQGSWYIDCTTGGGGYTREMLRQGAKVLSMDVDEEAIEHTFSVLGSSENLKLVKGNFKDLKRIVQEQKINIIKGIVFDLGVSQHQLKTAERGFSFRRIGRLDMRMDRDRTLSAFELINKADKGDLYEIFTKYGEEKRAWAIADAIIFSRSLKKITSTLELVEIIEGVLGKDTKTGKSRATRVFQAIRICINDELNNLKYGLADSLELLTKTGRLVVVSYHSLEDRIVKIEFQKGSRNKTLRILTDRPIIADENELDNNPSARSAKLRAVEKVAIGH